MRDLALLVGAGLLVGGVLLVEARDVYLSRPLPPSSSSTCIERWDEQKELLPHVDCADFARMIARKKGK